MNAKKMREIAEQANRDIAEQAKIKDQKAFETLKQWWLSEGYSALLTAIEQAAEKGKTSYTAFYTSACPKFVLTGLKILGFEVSNPSCDVGKYNYMLKVNW